MSKTTEKTAPAADIPPIPKGYWEAADGSLVPVSKISDLDKERDRVVRELVAAAEKASADLAHFKALALSAVQQFVEISAATYNVTIRGAAGKGNVTLTSYDGRYKVERQVAEHVAFDERLQVAKAGIDACIKRWGKGSNDNIKALVNHAFKTDKTGRVSVASVLSLRQVEITDDEWKQAMDALSDSIKAVASSTYVRFYRRNDETGQYIPISLNASSV